MHQRERASVQVCMSECVDTMYLSVWVCVNLCVQAARSMNSMVGVCACMYVQELVCIYIYGKCHTELTVYNVQM